MKISRPTSVLLSALVLIGGANVAVYAANGNPFILGQTNKETKPSVLKNTGTGPALKLNANGAPLAVNNSKKVRKLNADKVDGKNAGQLGTKIWLYELPSHAQTGTLTVTFPDLPPGRYQVSYRVMVSFTNSGPWEMSCAFTTQNRVAVYGTTYSSGFGSCAATGVVDAVGLTFQVGADDTFTAGTSADQWMFTRINSLVEKTPSTS